MDYILTLDWHLVTCTV